MLALAPTPVVLVRAVTTDDTHGWSEQTGEETVWEGQGNFQEDRQVRSDGTLSSGGTGPHGPAVGWSARLYLPLDCPVEDGMVVRLGDEMFEWLVTGVRTSRDPRSVASAPWDDPGPGLTCLVATCVLVIRGEATGDGDLP